MLQDSYGVRFFWWETRTHAEVRLFVVQRGAGRPPCPLDAWALAVRWGS